MTSDNQDQIIVNLSTPTAFPDLNQKEGKAADYKRDKINVQRLKFKHFRMMNELPQEKQMIYAISTLTGLSQNDVDELYAEDAAEITKVIIGFMKSFMGIAKDVMGNFPDDKNR